MKKRTSPRRAILKATDTIALLAEAVAEEYSADPSRAAVLISRLQTGEWYVCIQRYGQKWGEGKMIVTSAKEKQLEAAIIAVSHNWLDAKTAKRKLSSCIGSSDFSYPNGSER